METPRVELTERAIRRVRELVASRKIPATAGLRLAVQGGGCSGFSYEVHFEAEPKGRDQVFEFDGVRVFVDPKSLTYLAGTVVDFKDELLEQRFVFHNPNAKSSCSCGVSFSV